MDDKLKVINFLQDFGCATLKQLQILFNKPNDNFKNILSNNVISKKGDIFVHNTATIDIKMIYTIDILCKYKNRFKYFHKGFDTVYITFLSKENLLYNIIVTDKASEKGILKLLKINSPSIPEADRLILLFQDDSCLNNIICNTQFAYCVYPDMKILNKCSPIFLGLSTHQIKSVLFFYKTHTHCYFHQYIPYIILLLYISINFI